MIDAHLQTLAKPHLQPGEFVIWAEKTSPEAIEKESQEDIRSTISAAIASLVLISVLIFSFIADRLEGFEMDNSLDNQPLLSFGILLFFGATIWNIRNWIRAVKSPEDFAIKNPEMGYILTPGRLLIAEASGEIYSAATLKPPTKTWRDMEWKLPIKWKTKRMMIYPTKGKGISVSGIYLYYLADFKASKIAIAQAVKVHQKQ